MKFGWDNCVLIQVVFQNSTFAGGVVIGTSADNQHMGSHDNWRFSWSRS
jgi:hypothetical protein